MEFSKDIMQQAIKNALTKEELYQIFWSLEFRSMHVRKSLKLLREKVDCGEADEGDKRLIDIYQRESTLLKRLDFLFHE